MHPNCIMTDGNKMTMHKLIWLNTNIYGIMLHNNSNNRIDNNFQALRGPTWYDHTYLYTIAPIHSLITIY